LCNAFLSICLSPKLFFKFKKNKNQQQQEQLGKLKLIENKILLRGSKQALEMKTKGQDES
jgi:hypothetical protein